MPFITQSLKDDIVASKEHNEDKLFNWLTDNFTQSDYHKFSLILRKEINKSNYPSIYEYLTHIGEDETVEDIINEIIDDVMEYFEQ
ncbi:hypothetical protein GCM10008931_43190 [Oceanobacillus oncorhynchi subsp. oncorhynchi]|uniref:hypothetical protein n=1 Tax=Oceanobacillus oncorhynchi TaxID=545501 RepID=UPI0031DAD859